MIQDLLIGEIVEKAIEEIIELAKRKNKRDASWLKVSCENLEEHLNTHIKYVKNWSSEISFKDMPKSKRTSEVYIELDLNITPERLKFDEEEGTREASISKIFKQSDNHIVLLGQPGAGKTTSTKFICNSILFDEKYYPNKFNLPLLVRLRDLKSSAKSDNTLIDTLCSILNIQVQSSEKNKEDDLEVIKFNFLINLLEKISPLIVLDGFDEISTHILKRDVLDNFSKLTNQLEKARILFTSRTADYYYSIGNTSEFEICPLTQDQIKQFAIKWLSNDDKAKDFLFALRKSPFQDTAIRPLNLAHLCAIYERVNKIPDKPKTIYRKIVNLLLEEWNEQRRIERTTNYSEFEIDRKFEFMCALSFSLSTAYMQTSFNSKRLQEIYSKIYKDFELPPDQSEQVVTEIESHTGLFIKSRYDRYEFSHKSLQEFLTAEYLVKLPTIPTDKEILHSIPNELAIAIAISSRPSQYFYELITNRLSEMKLGLEFLQTFINRILIEKPSFNVDDKLGLAFLTLYSDYIGSGMNDGGQLRIFIIDNLVNEFEEFLRIIISKTRINSILKKYKFVEKSISVSNIEFESYKLNSKIIENEVNIKLPQVLYVRKDFLNSDSA